MMTEGESSHFAIAFDNKIVFESTINSGCRLSFYSEFMEKNHVVWRIDTEHSLEQEELVWMQCAGMDGMPYDIFGLVFFAYYLLKGDGDDIPTMAPRFGTNRSYLCVEVARCLKPVFNVPDDLSLTRPDALYDMFKSQGIGGH